MPDQAAPAATKPVLRPVVYNKDGLVHAEIPEFKLHATGSSPYLAVTSLEGAIVPRCHKLRDLGPTLAIRELARRIIAEGFELLLSAKVPWTEAFLEEIEAALKEPVEWWYPITVYFCRFVARSAMTPDEIRHMIRGLEGIKKEFADPSKDFVVQLLAETIGGLAESLTSVPPANEGDKTP